jgi:hypothetical protein
MKTTIYHWALAIVAWAIFIVSFFLPAFDQIPGWKAALLACSSWQSAIQGNPLAIHFVLLTFANLVMVVSPFFTVWGVRDGGFVKWLRGLSVAATVLVWLFLARLMAGHQEADLRVGCYLWAVSFVLLCLASLLQRVPLKEKPAEMV